MELENRFSLSFISVFKISVSFKWKLIAATPFQKIGCFFFLECTFEIMGEHKKKPKNKSQMA